MGIIFVQVLFNFGVISVVQAVEIVRVKGSDTMVQISQAWSAEFNRKHPGVGVAVMGGGTGVGIAMLLNGQIELANASREITAQEIAQAKQRGVALVQHVVAYDAIVSVMVHPDNPISLLKISQLAEIYGENPSITHWNQLGIVVPNCQSQEIIIASRQNSSGTYAHFRNRIMGHSRDFRLNMIELQSTKDLVQFVGNTPCAIGYGGSSYLTSKVRPVCVTEQDSSACDLEKQNAFRAGSGSFISRPLYIYSVGEVADYAHLYLDWVTSKHGQCIAKARGYTPIMDITCTGRY
ncbi:MAG: substrate-binding domain-containing protein [Magnetococcales bacterium]|nr:substrate-binding domain-containing protein [Magnetococcales bacterium]